MMTEARLFLLLATFTLSVSANLLPLPACMLETLVPGGVFTAAKLPFSH